MVLYYNGLGARIAFSLFFMIVFIAVIFGVWASINFTFYIVNDINSFHLLPDIKEFFHNIKVVLTPLEPICAGCIGLYNTFYLTIFNIPIFFWIIVIINIYLIYVLRFNHIKTSIQSIYVYYELNKKNSAQTIYHSFKHFIASSYGALSVAAVSEIIVLLHNYGTPGSIIWMSITIILIGGIQMIEIIINCYFLKKTNSDSCFISIMQYVAHKFKNKWVIQIISFLAILTVGTSFFSAVLFQTEQFANIIYLNKKDSLGVFIAIGGLLILIFSWLSVKYFDLGVRFNYKFIPPLIICYVLFLFIFIIFNFQEAGITIFAIIEGVFDKNAMLPGIVSGLVISFARYIYKSSNFDGDEFHIYEECDTQKTIVMYTLESLFMSFLGLITGTSILMIKFFPELNFFLGFGVHGIILIFTLFFAFSLIVNEAIYSQFAINHLIENKKNLRIWIIKIILITGIIFGLFKHTDFWVDFADHFSVILFIINIGSLFLIKNDIKEAYYNYVDEIDTRNSV